MKKALTLLATLAVASVVAGCFDTPPPPAKEAVFATHGLPAKWQKFELCTGFKKIGVK